ncbi:MULTISPECIES: hypothetical protein [Streptomyces]|uniref:hypothetical protein n=1 Tax=Streptomyces sp. NBC_01285 TaxID=2903813 RepID=UPI0027DAE871|nr:MULTISPECIES: hypothetical protein [Streptomyces]
MSGSVGARTFCTARTAYEVRDQPLAVLGTHPGAVHQVLLLRQWSKDAVFVMRGGVGGAVPQPQRLGVAVAGQVLDRQMDQRSLDDGEFAFMVGP